MDIKEFMRHEFSIMKDAVVQKQKPTHGPCCTCQKCGFNHDDCKCWENSLIELRNYIDQLQAALANCKLAVDNGIKDLLAEATENAKLQAELKAKDRRIAELEHETKTGGDIVAALHNQIRELKRR